MTTQDLLFPKGAPATEPAPPDALPCKEPATQARHFESAMDQALKRKVPAARPPGAAAKGASAFGSDNELPGNVVRLPERGSIGRGATQTLSDRDSDARIAAGEGAANGTDGVTEEESEPALETEESTAEESEATVQPSNIVLFPSPSVIIPFPLALACGQTSGSGSEGALVASAGSGEASPHSGEAESGSIPGHASDGPARNIVPLPTSPSKTPTPSTEARQEGIDVTKLGLTPSEGNQPAVAANPVASQGEASNSIISITFPKPEPRPDTALAQAPPELTQLPGSVEAAEDSAQLAEANANREESVELVPGLSKPPASGPLPSGPRQDANAAETTGISAAKERRDMNFSTDFKQGQALEERYEGAFDEFTGAETPSRGESTTIDFSARTLGATEWQAGRPVGNTDRLAPELSSVESAARVETVERISRLVVREAALVRQYHSDSMAVVLRPDAETELYVHLSQRNGQMEAVIRCDRGDAQQLGALWSQLQESLAAQKVRLAPLQESPANSNFNQSSAGPGFGNHGQGQGFSRQTPEKQFMDERPAPASSEPAHVRGRGGSGHRRVTTSRPGWETWA